MSGGSGPIDKRCAERLRHNTRPIVLFEQSSETEIFKHLSINRVAYFPRRRSLYFVESQHSNVQAILQSVLLGLKKSVIVEQLYLDRHKFFRGSLKIVVNENEAKPLLVALRLNGIFVSYPEPAIAR